MLSSAIASERVAHAWLFHGPAGSGKRAAALAFAQALQCTERSDGSVCGACSACHKVPRLVHPDVHVLIPHTNDATLQDVGARVALLAESPYAVIDYSRRPSLDGTGGASNKQVAYLLGQVQEELRAPMSYRPVEGTWRIAVLTQAQAMRTEGANAFLKLLEEPGGNTVFILLAERLDQVLPTIMSRCQQVRFAPLDVNEIADGLQREGLASNDMAPVLARMANGSFEQARELALSSELRSSREFVLNFLRHAYKASGDDMMSRVDALAAEGRESVKFHLLVLLGLIRDLLLFTEAGSDAPIVNVDWADVLSKFAQGLPHARLDVMADAVEHTMYLVERNVNVRIALTYLVIILSRSMRGDLSVSAVPTLV